MAVRRPILAVGSSVALLGILAAASPGPSALPASPPAGACVTPAIGTELPPAVDGLTASTTTPEGGGVVETSFPTVQGQPYVEIPRIESSDGVLATTLDVKRTTYTVGGRTIRGLTYQGGFMGPTLVVHPGDTLALTVRNALDQETNYHTHGLHTSPIDISDNVLRVMPGRTDNEVRIEVPDTIAPGTYWYHAHLHGLTEEQVFGGLSGALVIAGLEDHLPAALQGIPDHLLALKDVQLKGDAIVDANIDSGAPTTRLVNAQVNPVIAAQPGCTQLLRLGNFGADIWYKLALDGASFSVVAEDANLVTSVEAHDTLLLPPGKRFDVLVRWDAPGTHHLRTLKYSTGPQGDQYPERVLATFQVAGAAVTPVEMPADMGPLPADQAPTMADDAIAARHTFVFSEDNTAGTFFINDQQFTDGAPVVTAKLGTTEEWTLRNTSKEEHPFHIHVNDFQVMSINGKPVDAASLQDIVPLPVGGEVVIRMRFLDFTGKYVFHCHILAHEDAGMMASLAVTADGVPPTDAQQAAWGQPLLEHHHP